MEESIDYLKIFEHLGFNFAGSSDGKNFATECPWTGKRGKLVVNAQTGQWQSFVTDKSGNVYTFIREYYDLCLKETTKEDLTVLAKSKDLPVTSFDNEVAFNIRTGRFLIPFRNPEGKVINLSNYMSGRKKITRLPGLKTSLYGIEQLIDANFYKYPVYLCEGEWDMLALRWVFKALGIKAITLAVPGVMVFKEHWVPFFKDKIVNVCYDKDAPAYKGQDKVASMLRPVVEQIQFLEWPELLRDGYDIRDLLIDVGKSPTYSTKTLKDFLKNISAMMQIYTKIERDDPSKQKPFKKVEVPSFDEVIARFRKWLKLKSDIPVRVMFAACFANKIQGEPIWINFVGPPGSAKTELLMALSKSHYVETVTSLTPAALVSRNAGPDQGLLTKCNGRMLVVKDLTGILQSNPTTRDEIFGTLRDAYDGKVDRYFAGMKKSIVSRFGMLTGVTPIIENYVSISSALGERFLNLRFEQIVDEQEEEDTTKKALDNVGKDNKLREDLQEISYRFLEKKIPEKLPDVSDEYKKLISTLASLTSKMRATVIKDTYTGGIKTYPFREQPTRLAKQYMKLAMGLCVVDSADKMNETILKDIKQVCIDTLPKMVMLIVKLIYREIRGDENRSVSTKFLIHKLRLNQTTISGIISDLCILEVLVRTRGEERVASYYTLSPDIIKQINALNLFAGQPSAAEDRAKLPKGLHFRISKKAR